MQTKNVLHTVMLILLIIGGLNWGFVGLFHVDLVAAVFGYMSAIARLIYSIVGIAAIYVLFTLLIKTEKRVS